MAKHDIALASKGEKGETALNAWFQAKSLPYLFIGQSPDTFSTLFPKTTKRPDFLLLFQSLGLIAVDAKNYTLSEGVYTLNLEHELRKMLTFETLFRVPVWFAYMAEEGACWYWISGLKFLSVGDLRVNNTTNERFLAAKKNEFVEVRSSDDLAGLYTQKIASLDKLKQLMGEGSGDER